MHSSDDLAKKNNEAEVLDIKPETQTKECEPFPSAKLQDVLVIGAGIQGAGVAQACAAQGWKVTVLEKASTAGEGTSSRSSKLIHGGLRYLETAQFSLVYECLRERKILCDIAPDLVAMRHFLLPVYRSSKRHPLWVALGLFFYWLLSGCDKRARFRLRAKSDASALGLKEEGLRAIFEYSDAQTDDQKLTQAVLRSAEKMQADVRFNQSVVKITKFQSYYEVRTFLGECFYTKVLVNAAGPWVNHVASCIDRPRVSTNSNDDAENKLKAHSALGATSGFDPDTVSYFNEEANLDVESMPNISLVKGSHIVIDSSVRHQFYYFEAPQDARPMFVLPWYGKLLLGTTESDFKDSPDTINCSDEEAEYLLAAFNYYFPDHRATLSDVVSSFAGVRVLPSSEKNMNNKKRETSIVERSDGAHYIAIYGGKLTAYRATAEKVGKTIKGLLAASGRYISTKNIILDK